MVISVHRRGSFKEKRFGDLSEWRKCHMSRSANKYILRRILKINFLPFVFWRSASLFTVGELSYLLPCTRWHILDRHEGQRGPDPCSRALGQGTMPEVEFQFGSRNLYFSELPPSVLTSFIHVLPRLFLQWCHPDLAPWSPSEVGWVETAEQECGRQFMSNQAKDTSKPNHGVLHLTHSKVYWKMWLEMKQQVTKPIVTQANWYKYGLSFYHMFLVTKSLPNF